MALAALIDQRLLVPHFQPIVQLSGGSVHGHEALIRTPPGCRWANPDALFGAAREAGLSTRLEIECVRVALQAWSQLHLPGRLYLNLSAAALIAALAEPDAATLLTRLGNGMVAPESIVVELTEHEQVRDVEALALAVARLRRHKGALATTGQPSRAEITDAAMSSRAECVMLSKGPHISDAMRTLDNILRRMRLHQSKKRPLLRALKAWNLHPEA